VSSVLCIAIWVCAVLVVVSLGGVDGSVLGDVATVGDGKGVGSACKGVLGDLA